MIHQSNVLLEETLLEVSKKFDANTTSIRDNLYSKVEKALDSVSTRNNYKKLMGKFIESRATTLYDTIPIARIYFGDQDREDLFKCLGLDMSVATDAINRTYYGAETNFSPKCAKDEFTVTQLCVVRYFAQKNMTKEMELAVVHLAFSGMMYPSLHYRSFPIPPARHVMEYTVNNILSNKFDLVSEGSVMGAVRKISMTWLNTYKNKMRSFRDEECVYMLDQIHSRIGSYMKNLAAAYYDTYEHQDDLYIAYAGDSLEDNGNYHLNDSTDTLRVAKLTEASINYITTNGVDYTICNMCADENISPNEIKSIIETLFADPNNMADVRELISLLIVNYFNDAGKNNKDVTSVTFLTYSMTPKPNSKNREILRQKELIEKFLAENSSTYMRRRSRNATKNSYERALISYFALCIHNANR